MADLAQLGIVINVSDQNAAEKLTGLSTAANNATSSIDNLEGAAKRVASTLGRVGGKKATDGLKDTQTATEKAHKSYLEFLGDINKLDRAFAEIGKTQTGLKELQKNLNAIGDAATAAYNDGALVTKGFNDVGNASSKLALKIKEQKVALEALNSGYYDAQQTAAKDAAAKADQLKLVALHTQALKENKEITERWAKAARENAALITQEAKERKAASDEVKRGILEREKERDIMGADNRRATILEIKKETESRKEFLKALKEEIIERDKQTKKEQENITALNKFKEKQIALQKETALSYATADKEAQKYHETMGFLREAFDKIITRVGQFAAFLAAAAVVQAFTQAIKGAISVIIDFDQSLKSLEAIAGATATQASVMGDTIKQIAADTKFSAQEVAAGMETIGKAGFTAGESLAMIQDVANLATGAMEDLDKVSSLVITAINAFGMEVVQTAEITDIFANALIGSKLDIDDLAVAFNYVGAAGDQAGLSLNEVSGTLMVLSDNGVRASTMGTGLRKTLLSMLAPNKSLRDALDSVGMAYDDINTNIVGYEQALKNIAPLVWDFTNNTVDMSKAQAFFGTTASQVAAILIRETAQGGGISTAIKSTEEYGSALAMAQKQQEGLGVKTKNLQDHLKNVALAVGEAGLTKALHKLADALKFVISNLESLFKNYPVTQFAGYAAAATAIAAAIYGIYNALEALVTSSAFKMLFGGLFTTPLGQVTIAILGVATALTALYSRIKDAPKEFEKLSIEINKQIDTIESWRKVLAKASEEGLDAYESQIVKFISSNKELSKQILKSINERREAGEELYTSFEDLLLSAGNVKAVYKLIDDAMKLQHADEVAKDIQVMASAAQLSAVHFSNLEIKIAGTMKQLDDFFETSDDPASLHINGVTDGNLVKALDKFITDLDGTKKILQQYGKDIAQLVMNRAELTNQTKEWGIALIEGLEQSLGGEGVKAALEQFGILWELQLKKAEEDALNAIPEIVGAKWLGVLSDTIRDMESKIPMLKIADYEKGKAELIKNLDEMREIIIESDLFKSMGVSTDELNIALQGLLEQGLIDLVKGFDGVKTSTDNAKSSTEKLHEKIVELKEELSGADLSFATESGKLSAPLAETIKIFKEAGGSFGEFSDIILKLASDTDGLNLALEDLTMEGKKISFGGDLETVYDLTLALEAYKQKLEVYKYAIEVQKEVRSEEEKFREEVGKVNEAMEVVGLSVEDATKKVELLSKTMADSDVSANSLSNAIKAAGVQAGLTEVELTDLIIKIRELNTEAKIDKNLEKIHEYQSKLVEKNAEAYDEMYEKAYDFTRDVIDDFDSMGDTLVDLAENMVKDIAAAFLTQTIVMPVYMYAANELGMSSLISGASGVSTTGSSAGATVSGAYNAYSAYGSLTGGTADAIAKVLGSEIGSAVGEYIFGAEAWGGYNTIGSLANLPGEAAYDVAANAAGTGTTYSTGMVNSLSAASAAGIISSLAYTYLGEMLELPQGEYSGIGAGIGGGAGYTIGTSLASGAASGATSGSWAGPVGAIVGAIVGGVGAALLGEDEPDYRIGLFPGNFDWEGSDRMATSENYGYSIATQDYSVKNVESLFSFFDDVFQALDEATTASINDIVAGAQTGDYGRISWFDPSEMSTEDIIEGMTTDLFRAIREGLVEDIGAGFDADVFTFDFFESIQAEGENLLDTYLGFREAAETLGTAEFLEQFNYQVDTLNVSAAQAYENMKVIAETVYSMTETANALSSTANMTTFEETVNSWQVLIETLERVKATSEQLTEAELARNEVLGSQVTGLTATTIESQILNGGDLNDLVSTQITAIATSSIAETIYAEYIESLNEEAGRVFAESDYDINVLIEYLQGIDTTEAQNKIEELQESFGLLAESANDALDTAEAMRIVTLAIEGQLTVAQKFEEWQISNIEAMNLFSEITADSVTADELESAVDAFAALGIEGDDLSNVIQDLADTFTEATDQMYENISNIESAQSELVGSEDTTESYLNAMKDVVDFFKATPSLAQIRGDEQYITTEFDEEAYNAAIAAAVVNSEFQSILGRNSSSDYYQNALVEGSIGLNDIHDAIVDGISSSEDTVNEIFNRLFGRSASSSYWADALEDGLVSLSDLESEILSNAAASDLEYYNTNGGQVEITNWEDFETAAGLLGVSEDDYYNQVTHTATGDFSTSEAEVSAALDILEGLPDIIDSSGNLISSALDEFVNTVGTMDSAVLEDIFGSEASSQISAMVDAISNYESSLSSDSETSDSAVTTDDTQDQIDDIFATIQEGLDTINLSDFEQEIYDITKQSQEWTDSLSELGVTSAEDLAIIDEWVAAQRQALVDAFSDDWQDIINENTLSDTSLELLDLEEWYEEQKAAAEELGMSLYDLTEAYDLQKESINEARQAEIDAFNESIQDIINENTLSDTDLNLLDLAEWYAEQTAAADELGLSLDTLTEAYDLQKEAIESARQSEVDSLLESSLDYLSKSGLSDFDSTMLDLEKEAASLTDQLTELNATESELSTITEWLAENEKELIQARQSEIDDLLESSSDYLSKVGLSDFESQMLDLEKEAASLTEQLTELNATESELATVSEWLSANEQELLDARQSEINSLLESVNDYLSKSGLSDFESDMLDLKNEANSLTDQLTDLGATSEELATVTEWLAANEQDLLDARQSEIDSLLKSATDYISKSGLTDFESNMLDLQNESESLTEQLIELNATNKELGVVTEWLSLKEQELLDARQEEIDAFNESIQDIINENTLSDTELDLFNLENWYEEQKESAEALGISLGSLTQAYDLQKEAIEDARQEEIDAFNDSIQDIINENTLSDTSLELLELETWYEEQAAAAEELSISLDDLTEAFLLLKNVSRGDLTESWQDIINENTLSDTDIELLDLEEWYKEQKQAANALGMSLDTLTEAYELQKNAIEDTIAEITNGARDALISGYASFNKALDDTYRSPGDAVLELSGLRRDGNESLFDSLSLTIDNLNGAISSTEDDVFDFSTSLLNLGAGFQSLNESLISDLITTDQYTEILGALTSRYEESISKIEETKDAYEGLSESIDDTIDSILSSTESLPDNADALFGKFQDAFANVMAGDYESVSDMNSFAESYLSAFAETATSQVDYDRQQGLILRSLKLAEEGVDTQVDSIDALLEVAEQQLVDMSDIADLTNEELSALYSIDNTITDILDALSTDDARKFILSELANSLGTFSGDQTALNDTLITELSDLFANLDESLITGLTDLFATLDETQTTGLTTLLTTLDTTQILGLSELFLTLNDNQMTGLSDLFTNLNETQLTVLSNFLTTLDEPQIEGLSDFFTTVDGPELSEIHDLISSLDDSAVNGLSTWLSTIGSDLIGYSDTLFASLDSTQISELSNLFETLDATQISELSALELRDLLPNVGATYRSFLTNIFRTESESMIEGLSDFFTTVDEQQIPEIFDVLSDLNEEQTNGLSELFKTLNDDQMNGLLELFTTLDETQTAGLSDMFTTLDAAKITELSDLFIALDDNQMTGLSDLFTNLNGTQLTGLSGLFTTLTETQMIGLSDLYTTLNENQMVGLSDLFTNLNTTLLSQLSTYLATPVIPEATPVIPDPNQTEIDRVTNLYDRGQLTKDWYTSILDHIATSGLDDAYWDLMTQNFGKGYAEGGIASGPTSGYPVTLHGAEAIIPLNNGYIPLQMNNDPLISEIKELRAEVKNLKAGIFQIAKNTKETVDYLDLVTDGENSMQTRAAV